MTKFLIFSVIWTILNYLIVYVFIKLKVFYYCSDYAILYYLFFLFELIPGANILVTIIYVIVFLVLVFIDLYYEFEEILTRMFNKKNIFEKREIKNSKKLKLLTQYLIDAGIFKNKDNVEDAINSQLVKNKLLNKE